MDNKTLDAAIAAYKAKAADARETAAHNGEWNDGGESRMLELLQAFNDGRNGTVPSFLRPFIKQAEREQDPEYAQYLRLKAKFKEAGHE